MFPIKCGNAIHFPIGHSAISLIFYVKKFGGIKPYSRAVRYLLNRQVVRQGFAVHSSRIPDLLYFLSVDTWRSGKFRTVSDGINIGNGGEKVFVNQNSPVGLN